MDDDRELRKLYQRIRQADMAGVPSAGAVLDRRRGPRSLLWAWTAAAAAAVALVFWLTPPPTPGPVSLAEWRSPTAFLLESPSGSFVDGVPPLGRIPMESLQCESCF